MAHGGLSNITLARIDPRTGSKCAPLTASPLRYLNVQNLTRPRPNYVERGTTVGALNLLKTPNQPRIAYRHIPRRYCLHNWDSWVCWSLVFSAHHLNR